MRSNNALETIARSLVGASCLRGSKSEKPHLERRKQQVDGLLRLRVSKCLFRLAPGPLCANDCTHSDLDSSERHRRQKQLELCAPSPKKTDSIRFPFVHRNSAARVCARQIIARLVSVESNCAPLSSETIRLRVRESASEVVLFALFAMCLQCIREFIFPFRQGLQTNNLLRHQSIPRSTGNASIQLHLLVALRYK